jgi:hypothetical protein
MAFFVLTSLGVAALLSGSATAQNSSIVTDPLRYVDQLIGTGNGGKVLTLLLQPRDTTTDY